jgi:hypothetical protein
MADNESAPVAPQAADDRFTPWRFAAVLAALICAAYPEVLVGVGTFFHRDYAVFGYPLAYYHRQSFWRGEVPLWNPLNDCGLPFLAQWNTLVLYPLSLIYLLFPLSWSLGIFCLAHFFLAGMGMYFLACRWTQNRFAAAVAGLVFPFNALMLNCLMWPNNIAAMCWLPWVVLATERAWRDGGRSILLAVAVGAMQMLAGAPEVILLTWVLLAALFLGELVSGVGQRRLMCARFLGIGVWVAGLAAAQLLPFLELLSHSQRGKAFADATWSMPAWGWANLLVPLFRAYRTQLGDFAQPGQYWISSYYPGVGVCAMALVALLLVRRRLVWLLGILAGVCLVLCLGNHGLLYPAMKSVVPGLGFMRYPIKFVILPTALFPLLAALALAHCLGLAQADWARTRKRVVALGLALLAIVVGLIGAAFFFPLRGASPEVAATSGAKSAALLVLILAGFIALRGVIQPPWATRARLGLLLLLWLDAMTALPRPNPTAPRWVYEPNLALKELQLAPPPRIGEARVMLNAEAEGNLAIAPMTNAVNQVLYARLALYANVNLLDDIPKVVGMYSLFPRESGEAFAALWGTAQPPAGLADFLGVSHINVPGKANEWQPRPTHLPWVTAGQGPQFADAAATLAALASAEFDPRRTVFLPAEARSLVAVSNAAPAKVSLQRFSAHKVELEVEAPAPAMVVIAQAFYPNWRARIDGHPADLLRANHAFQALAVPAGKHHVALAYHDRAFHVGTVISASCVLAWAGLWLIKRRKVPS